MVQISGKYEHSKNVNFKEFLLKNGYPEDMAKKINESKPILEAKLDGDKLTVKISIDGSVIQTIDYVLGQEVEEILHGAKLKSIPNLVDNILTVDSVDDKGNHGKRTYTFKDSDVEVVISAGGAEAKRIYKRL